MKFAILLVTFLLIPVTSFANMTCSQGCNQQIQTTISQSITEETNNVGQFFSSDRIAVGYYDIYESTIVHDGSLRLYKTLSYPSDPDIKTSTWNYFSVNDYLSVGAAIIDEQCSLTHYAPVSYQEVNQNCGPISLDNKAHVSSSSTSIVTQIYIKKKMIGGSYATNKLVLYYYASDESNGTDVKIADTYVNGTITVPESCTINAGTVLPVNLGTLYEGDFRTVGKKPDNYTPKTFNIPIHCSNISAFATLTLRVQGTQSSGFSDALQSDNADMGVVITNSSGDILSPNNTSSFVPFTVDGNLDANVTLHAYPVGTTGNNPAIGPFTTLAYLRVDFS